MLSNTIFTGGIEIQPGTEERVSFNCQDVNTQVQERCVSVKTHMYIYHFYCLNTGKTNYLNKYKDIN